MTEVAVRDIGVSQPSADAGVHISDAGKDAIHLMMGVQTAFLQEMVFAGYVVFAVRELKHTCLPNSPPSSPAPTPSAISGRCGPNAVALSLNLCVAMPTGSSGMASR